MLVAGCASNTPPGPTWTCGTPDVTCWDFFSGWDEPNARAACDAPMTFGFGNCPAGRIAHCIETSAGGAVTIVSWYSGFGDGTVAFARRNCPLGFDFGAP
jgi:hypothetical protein